MFKELQEQHKKWAMANFGVQVSTDYALGMIEEVGELAHAILKRKQGIRNTENHNENIKDAIGDITIYLIGYSNHLNIDLQPLYENYSPIVWSTTVLSISKTVNEIANTKSPSRFIICLFGQLILFCKEEGIDFEDTVLTTWNNVVSKRDWKKNPDCLTEEQVKEELNLSSFDYIGEISDPIAFMKDYLLIYGTKIVDIEELDEKGLIAGNRKIKSGKFFIGEIDLDGILNFDQFPSCEKVCDIENLTTDLGLMEYFSKINLCDDCKNTYPKCGGEKLLFGDGKGNDNIIKCDSFVGKSICDGCKYLDMPCPIRDSVEEIKYCNLYTVL